MLIVYLEPQAGRNEGFHIPCRVAGSAFGPVLEVGVSDAITDIWTYTINPYQDGYKQSASISRSWHTMQSTLGRECPAIAHWLACSLVDFHHASEVGDVQIGTYNPQHVAFEDLTLRGPFSSLIALPSTGQIGRRSERIDIPMNSFHIERKFELILQSRPFGI